MSPRQRTSHLLQNLYPPMKCEGCFGEAFEADLVFKITSVVIEPHGTGDDGNGHWADSIAFDITQCKVVFEDASLGTVRLEGGRRQARSMRRCRVHVLSLTAWKKGSQLQWVEPQILSGGKQGLMATGNPLAKKVQRRSDMMIVPWFLSSSFPKFFTAGLYSHLHELSFQKGKPQPPVLFK
ncbi:hypothetical protein CPB84DRAFT_1752547 [Gymnopilus junonius]|uniref:Uncharacterized protein n=1 Tax=Gymnopilus junonius TaxID=109634 RepID=A0A9P5NBL0_GYMJU|nr:hypothetical protein CPB84DRAFT_1752547 [Gymnopilus junonius]